MTEKGECATALQSILDTMSGMDGGISFLEVKAIAEYLDEQAVVRGWDKRILEAFFIIAELCEGDKPI